MKYTPPGTMKSFLLLLKYGAKQKINVVLYGWKKLKKKSHENEESSRKRKAAAAVKGIQYILYGFLLLQMVSMLIYMGMIVAGGIGAAQFSWKQKNCETIEVRGSYLYYEVLDYAKRFEAGEATENDEKILAETMDRFKDRYGEVDTDALTCPPEIDPSIMLVVG